jgi:hypothetical protein
MIGLDTLSVQQRLKLKKLDECNYWNYFEIEIDIEIGQSQMKITTKSIMDSIELSKSNVIVYNCGFFVV